MSTFSQQLFLSRSLDQPFIVDRQKFILVIHVGLHHIIKHLKETINIIAKYYELSRYIFNIFKYVFKLFEFPPNLLLSTGFKYMVCEEFIVPLQ
jgi:hypothetical protein